ncbi:ABC transporter substrate-binding protein [Nocardiopsis ganjiahuensis]|uniref:ABC transporter substrate-binding protein n=1 Tax=Nocardiopsis ganjiahuensis TaxID=239984 RepID=UPI000477FC99|nr:ABC transporter substrate-binding protein [Nocardiopsis ganjiahuensis]
MKSLRLPAALAALVMVASACSGEGGEGGGSEGYPRNETLYTTGTAWGPPTNWNPIMEGNYAVGTVGLVYEPLFLFDPNENEYTPWLAESDEWPDENTHVITLREGVEWTDGEPLVAEDVVTTLELGHFDIHYSNVWDYLESAEATGEREVTLTFSEPRPQEWMNWVSARAIVPDHIWADKDESKVTDDPNQDPVGTGAYVYENHADDRMVWKRNDDWWGTEALGLEMKPTYIVDIVNASNDVTMNMLNNHEIDLSNNFLPGIDQVINDDNNITSYYAGAPYMQSANTAWLIPNHEHPALGDPVFRSALAHAIDLEQIVTGPYTNLVEPADPSGLLPQWDDYIDHELVSEEGFSFDASEAVAILEEAGYLDEDGDGFVETPDGEEITLTLEVPSGWTDWMESANVIAGNAQEVGINVEPAFPEHDLLIENFRKAEFDLMINNDRGLSNTPWTYYDFIFQLPINEQQTTANYARYENEEAWDLTQQLAAVPADDVEGAAEITSDLQEIFLEDLPIIPLWYNGMWSQASNNVWTNWPSEASDTPDNFATMWNNMYQMGAIYTLAEIELAE